MPDLGVVNPQNLSRGHLMHTEAHLLSERGLLVGSTQIESTTLFGGFHGGVVVSMFADEELLGASPVKVFGVDGRAIGTYKRDLSWTHQFDPELAKRATRLMAVHTWEPDWMKSLENTGAVIKFLIDFFSSLAGSGSPPAGAPGNGSLGGPEAYPLSRAPFSTYAAPRPPIVPQRGPIGGRRGLEDLALGG